MTDDLALGALILAACFALGRAVRVLEGRQR